MSPNVKAFIEDNIELIDGGDWGDLLDAIYVELTYEESEEINNIIIFTLDPPNWRELQLEKCIEKFENITTPIYLGRRLSEILTHYHNYYGKHEADFVKYLTVNSEYIWEATTKSDFILKG